MSDLSSSAIYSCNSCSKLVLKCILIFQLFSLSSQSSFLTLSCGPKVTDSCPKPSTRCDKQLGLCECVPEYPIPSHTLRKCLSYCSLGEECVVSKQCKHITNALCLNSNGHELRETFLRLNLRRSSKIKGQCKCRSGYRQNSKKRCDLISGTYFENFVCTGSHQCLSLDLNTHCDSFSKRCFCDNGFVYDTDKGECILQIKKFGQTCSRNEECENWDINMECANGVCLCKDRYVLNPNNRCNPLPDTNNLSPLCEYGFKWDQSAHLCRPQPLYDVRTGEYRFFSVDKLLETIVIVIFCFVTIAFMRFWRYILPQNITESQNGIFSDFSHANRVQRRRSNRSNSLRNSRVVRLRLNMDSPEPHESYLSDEAFVALPLATSHSSLPTYESAGNSAPVTTDYQVNDEPPTYEEAMALSLNQTNDKK